MQGSSTDVTIDNSFPKVIDGTSLELTRVSRHDVQSATYHVRVRGIAFPIEMDYGGDRGIVRVIVTIHALADLAEKLELDMSAAFGVFAVFRERIERAAREKVVRMGRKPQDYEGIATVVLLTGEPI